MADATTPPSRVWPFIFGAVAGFAGAYLFVLPPRQASGSSTPRLPAAVTPVATPVRRPYQKPSGPGYYVLVYDDPPSKKGRELGGAEGPFRDSEGAKAEAYYLKKKWRYVSVKKLKKAPITEFGLG